MTNMNEVIIYLVAVQHMNVILQITPHTKAGIVRGLDHLAIVILNKGVSEEMRTVISDINPWSYNRQKI